LSDFQKRADRYMRGLCGASDYGRFSAHSPFFFRLTMQLYGLQAVRLEAENGGWASHTV